MSLSSAAVSPQRAPDPAGPRVLIGGGRVAGLKTMLALNALAGDRLESTMPAPDRKFINRSISEAQPCNPRRVGGLSLEDTLAGVGDWWDRKSFARSKYKDGIAGAWRSLANPPRGRKTRPRVNAGAASLAVGPASKASQ